MVTLENVIQSDFDVAEALVISHVRDTYPGLDLRRGTVLREQLIRPASILQALNDARALDKTSAITLADLKDKADPDISTINSLLSNFNLEYNSGSRSRGFVKIYFSGPGSYAIPAAAVFSTDDSVRFETDVGVVVTSGSATPTLIKINDTRYYGVVPATAVEPGTVGNVPTGTNLTSSEKLVNLIGASAYSSFGGGTDPESVETAISRIKPALAQRSLANPVSVLGLFRDKFGSVISGVSLQGFGAPAQWRDRMNVHGISHGGCVDAYVRTFNSAPISVLTKVGYKDSNGDYVVSLSRYDAEGYYAVRSVTDDDGSDTAVENPSVSYLFKDSRAATSGNHSIPTADLAVFSVYQAGMITVMGVDDTAESHEFKLEFYVAPGLGDIQAYADSDAIRNEGTDFLVRSPLLCLVGFKAVAYQTPGSDVSGLSLKTKIASYINGLGFKGKLSLSELIHVICSNGIQRVGMRPGELAITGRVLGADMVWRVMTGDTVLDLDDLKSERALIGSKTTVFVCDPYDVDIQVRTQE